MKTYLPLVSHRRSAACALFLFAQPLHAEVTPVQTLPFTGGSDGTFTNLLSDPINLNIGEPLTGFQKFDPALGTLTEIRITAEVRATFGVGVSAEQVDDENSPFTVRFEDSGSDLLQVSVIYNPTGENFGKSLTIDNANSGSAGATGADPLDWGAPGGFSFSDSTGSEFGGFAGEGDTPTEGSLLTSDPDINLSDFVGTGTVPGLSITYAAQIENTGSLENVPEAFIEVEIGLEPGSVTLQYVYTPAAPAVPTKITGYTKSGTNHTILFTGEAGRSDWVVKGGNDLITFGTDHTAAATISETSAGVYQVLLSLPELTEPRYFFRIEE
jgi:hypothetical protein